MVKFKEWDRMAPGSHPRHQHHDERWIRYHKGHDVTRPFMKYSTSKWDQSMLDVYEILFDPFKYLPITLFEIGIYEGESLRYFREFFKDPATQLIGLDKQGLSGGSEVGDNFVSITGNQQDLGLLQQIVDTYGPFDVVMDDGSHDKALTYTSFNFLWPHVKEGGFYIVEDMGHPDMHDMLDWVVATKQGKGFISLNTVGFGPYAGAGGITVLKKTKDTITGLDKDLTGS